MLKDWKVLSGKSEFTDFSNAMDLYMLSRYNLCPFQVLVTHSKYLSLLFQQKKQAGFGVPLKNEEDVDTAAFDCFAT